MAITKISAGQISDSAFTFVAVAATTAAGTLATGFENGDTLDGATLATNDIILIKDQSTASENGIYAVNASGAPTRVSNSQIVSQITYVRGGSTNADKLYVYAATNTFEAVSGGGSSGWALTGNAGTTPGTDFVGTTDAQDFVVKTQGFERARFLNEANGSATLDFSAQAASKILAANDFLIDTQTGYLNTTSLGASHNYGTAEMTLTGDSLKIKKATGVQPVQFFEDAANGSDFIALKSPDSVTTSTTYILPNTQPTVGQYLKASAPVADVVTTSWDTPSGGGGGGGVMFLPFSGSVSNSFTTYAAFLGATRAIYSTETDASIAFSAGTFSKITVYVQLNSQSADVVYTLRKNGAAAGASLTIPAGNTGLFTLTINETILATDLVCLEVVSTSFGLYTATNSFMTFTAS